MNWLPLKWQFTQKWNFASSCRSKHFLMWTTKADFRNYIFFTMMLASYRKNIHLHRIDGFVILLCRIWFGHSLTVFSKRECNFHERWILLLSWSRCFYSCVHVLMKTCGEELLPNNCPISFCKKIIYCLMKIHLECWGLVTPVSSHLINDKHPPCVFLGCFFLSSQSA